MDRQRLSRIADRKVRQEQPKIKQVTPCLKCGNESFLFDFRRTVTTKTCKNVSCKAVEVVEGV